MPTVTPSIRDAIEHFLEHTQQTTSRAKFASYHQALQVFGRFLEQSRSYKLSNTPLSAITVADYHEFLAYLQSTYAPETEHSYFRGITTFAYNSGVDPDTLKHLHGLAQKTRRKKLRLSPQIPFAAVQALSTYIQQVPVPEPDPELIIQRERLRTLRDKALLFTITSTGLKPTETTSLRVGNFDREQASLSFQTLSLPLTTQTVAAVHDYLRERTPLDQQQNLLSLSELPLFARHDKRASTHILPISRWTVGNIISHWADMAIDHTPDANGNHVTPSLLRHHFVASTLASTDDLALTQQRARHKDLGTTRHYLPKQNTPIDD